MTEEVGRYRKLNHFWQAILYIFSALSLLLAINQIFRLRLFGFLPIDTGYIYYILALTLSLTFIIFPARKSQPRNKVPWYDVILFGLSLLVNMYFALHALDIVRFGWEYVAPLTPTFFSVILWFLALEAARRAAGLPLAIICLIFSFYPLYCGYLPGFLRGQSFDFFTVARNHAMSVNSILGAPLTTGLTLLFGFLVFGVVMQYTGGGEFFFKLAQTLLGNTRGGPAKVAVVGSAFFGMLSGSAVSNVATIGPMTIPVMKRIGYPPQYAGAVEACASTGGTIMPPIMGAAAFIMASFLGRSYGDVMVAAIIPSLLYYFGIFVQVDGYAAKANLKGVPRSELPSLRVIFKTGWYYLLVIVLMVYFLLQLRVEAWAPFYACGLLIILAMLRKETRLKGVDFLAILEGSAKVLVEILAILAAVGLLVGALSVTGVAFSFSRELVAIVGNNVMLILVAGAVTSFILGFGMTITACYIFLAIVMVPALTALGINPIAAHFFVLYWGMISYITPPVALAAYVAAALAKADFIKTGLLAMRLAAVIYFIPFFFVYNPALLGQGTLGEVLYAAATGASGVLLMASSLEGFLIGFGKLSYPVLRASLMVAGIMLMLPERFTDLIGALVAFAAIAITYLVNTRRGCSEFHRNYGVGSGTPSSINEVKEKTN